MRYTPTEGALRATVWAELPAYRVADAASELLLWVIERAAVAPHEGEENPPPSYWRSKACLYLGLIAVRTTRAAMAVLSVGYEAESMSYKRTLWEVHARIQRVLADESGSYAREWLSGRARSPTRAIDDPTLLPMYQMLSHSSHADFRAVENFLAISEEDGSTTLLTMPERRAAVSNGSLAMFAGETRDIANLIAHERGIEIEGLAQLDEAIDQHYPYGEENESE